MNLEVKGKTFGETSKRHRTGGRLTGYALASALVLGGAAAATLALKGDDAAKKYAKGSDSVSEGLGMGDKNPEQDKKAERKNRRREMRQKQAELMKDGSWLNEVRRLGLGAAKKQETDFFKKEFYLPNDGTFEQFQYQGTDIRHSSHAKADNSSRTDRIGRPGFKSSSSVKDTCSLLSECLIGDLCKNFLSLDESKLALLSVPTEGNMEATISIRNLPKLADAAIVESTSESFSYIADSLDSQVSTVKGFLEKSYNRDKMLEDLEKVLSLRKIPDYNDIKHLFAVQGAHVKICLFFDKFEVFIDSKTPPRKVKYFTRTMKQDDHCRLLDIFVVAKKPCSGASPVAQS